MSPRKRYLIAILFWLVSLLVLFAIRKIFFPIEIEGHDLTLFKIPAAGVCVLVGLIRLLDTIYNCAHGMAVSVRGIRPIEIVHFDVSPLRFLFSLLFELFMWSMLTIMMWPLFYDSITKLR